MRVQIQVEARTRHAAVQRRSHTRRLAWVMVVVFGTLGAIGLVTASVLETLGAQSDAAEIAAFEAAPSCPAASECRHDDPATVVRTYTPPGRNSRPYVVLSGANGQQLDVRGPGAVPVQMATPGHPVVVTSWHGAVVQVSDSSGILMVTDDHPGWRAGDHAQAVAPMRVVGVLALLYAAGGTIILRRRPARPRRV